jgi:hypothetical protein
MVAADSNQQMIANDDGCSSRSIIEFRIGDLYAPSLFTGPRIEADKMTIRRFEE